MVVLVCQAGRHAAYLGQERRETSETLTATLLPLVMDRPDPRLPSAAPWYVSCIEGCGAALWRTNIEDTAVRVYRRSNTMDSMIKGLFGGDDKDDRRSQANDFISRYEQGPVDQGYDENEAYEHFQRVSQHADPDTIQRASEQAFSRMDPQQRAQFAQQLQQQGGGQMGQVSDDPRQMAGMVSQMHRQNPSGLAGLFGGGGSGGGGIGDALGGLLGGGGSGGGGGGFPGGNLGKVAMGGIAAYAMKEIMGGGNDNKGRRRSI